MSNLFIHETALVEDCTIGSGTKVWAFTHICGGATIGNDCTIGEGVYIGPGVVIGDRCKVQNGSLIYKGVSMGNEVFVGPNVVTTNDVMPRAVGDWGDRFRETHFMDGASVGANSTILCGISLGEKCMVAAGSVVSKSVMNHSLVRGNPARHIRFLDD